MINKKNKRHSGRKTICIKDKDYPFQETFWDDWNDYRDSFRGNKDKKLIRKTGMGYGKKLGKNLNPEIKKNNLKLKKYYKIRKARKSKPRYN